MASVVDLEFVAGHLALDFINTVDDRLSPHPDEYLEGPDDLTAWGITADLLDGHCAPTGDDEYAAAIALREHLTALLDARATGRPAGAVDRDALSREAADAYTAGSLQEDADGALSWHWDRSDPATVRHRVATAAVELLGDPAATRVGRCDADECGWFFLDTTKRGNRRWCSMSDCGQQAKSARRRANSGSRRAG